MTWKTETRVCDLPGDTDLEVTCKSCGLFRYEIARQLVSQARLGQLYLDELERALYCRDKHCRGSQRIAITYEHLSQAFIGGMA